MTKRGAPWAYLLASLTTMPTGCTTWPFSVNGRGYGKVTYQGQQVHVHSLVCEWYHGERPTGLVVRHLCGNGELGCFTPSHMAWGTRVEDAADRVAHGTQHYGPR